MTSRKILAIPLILASVILGMLIQGCSDMGKNPEVVGNRPPVITSSSSATAFENVRFVYRAVAADPDGTTPEVSFDHYPAWLSVTSETISGTPAPGTPDTSFQVNATDGSLSASITVTVTVQDTGSVANQRPIILSEDTASAAENSPFSYRAIAEDPDGTTPEISFERFAAWLAPSSDSITGTPPTGAADTSFIIIASDGLLADTLEVSITIISGPALVSYVNEVQPVFTANCAIPGCHMGMNPPAGLRLMSYQMLMDTTSHRAVIIPYEPDSSILVKRIEGTILPRMPYNGPPYLPDSTIQTIRTWIAQGALDN